MILEGKIFLKKLLISCRSIFMLYPVCLRNSNEGESDLKTVQNSAVN